MARTYISESAEDIVRRNLRQIYAVKDTPPELRARITAMLLEDGHPHVGGGGEVSRPGAAAPATTEDAADAIATTAAIPLAQDSPNGGPCPRCGAARVVFDTEDGAAVYGCQECRREGR